MVLTEMLSERGHIKRRRREKKMCFGSETCYRMKFKTRGFLVMDTTARHYSGIKVLPQIPSYSMDTICYRRFMQGGYVLDNTTSFSIEMEVLT